NHESRRDADEVVAGEDEDAPRRRDARLLKYLLTPAIAGDQCRIPQPRVIRRTTVINDDNRHLRRLQVMQHPPANPAQATEDKVVFHDAPRTIRLPSGYSISAKWHSR